MQYLCLLAHPITLTGIKMKTPLNDQHLKSDLIFSWVIVGVMFTMLAAMIVVCQVSGQTLQQPLPEDQRVLFRSVFYIIAIVTFPLTNLIRHIQLRLNQTMPISEFSFKNIAMEAKRRYLITNIISMSIIEVVGVFGLIMYLWGDGYNTLYIFTGLSVLGLFLYRPKIDEYLEIIEALATQKNE